MKAIDDPDDFAVFLMIWLTRLASRYRS